MLTPEVKQQIAEEVKAQIALENAEAQQTRKTRTRPRFEQHRSHALRRQSRMSLWSATALDVDDAPATSALSATAMRCSFPRHRLRRDGRHAGSSRHQGRQGMPEDEPPSKSTVADLQEMQNHMRETIDKGLQELQAKQGTGGLPPAPPSAQAPPVQTAFAQAAPPPPPNGEADVNQQLTAADQAEQEANQPASPIGAVTPAAGAALTPMAPPPSPDAAPAATINIAVGQSIDQVTAALGAPVAIVDLGPKKIYKYKDMKITFRAGKVAAVE